jgi:hypothetical protein
MNARKAIETAHAVTAHAFALGGVDACDTVDANAIFQEF